MFLSAVLEHTSGEDLLHTISKRYDTEILMEMFNK